MATGEGWDAEKMFQIYLHDYLVKKNYRKSAKTFAKEAHVRHSAAIDAPEGFFSEWWSICCEILQNRLAEGSTPEADTKRTEAEPLDDKINGNTVLNNTTVQPASSFATGITYEEEHNKQITGNFGPCSPVLDIGQTRVSKSLPSIASPSQHDITRQVLQSYGNGDIGLTSNLEGMVPEDPTIYEPPRKLSRPGLIDVNSGVNPGLMMGSHLMGVDHTQNLRYLVPSLVPQMPNRQQKLEKSRVHQQMMIPMQKKPSYEQWRSQFLEQHSHESFSVLLQDCQNIIDGTEEENVEYFLSDGNASADSMSTFGNDLQQPSPSTGSIVYNDFSMEEVGHLNSGCSLALCCHFSSNGKWLAGGGLWMTVKVWDVETLQLISHATDDDDHFITDVRFKPNSSVFATSSTKQTVQLWDAYRPNRSFKLCGQTGAVMSLDFHPRRGDLLCSCDQMGGIHLWNVSSGICARSTKGADRLVRFQPQVGNLLAGAIKTGVSVIDVETDCTQSFLKGHAKRVTSICWDMSGKYIATVSEDLVKLWLAASSGKCIHELHSNGRRFYSCTFHPGYPLCLVVSSSKFLEVWNPMESCETMLVKAHDELICGLADSQQAQMIASSSNDQSIKLWK